MKPRAHRLKLMDVCPINVERRSARVLSNGTGGRSMGPKRKPEQPCKKQNASRGGRLVKRSVRVLNGDGDE